MRIEKKKNAPQFFQFRYSYVKFYNNSQKRNTVLRAGPSGGDSKEKTLRDFWEVCRVCGMQPSPSRLIFPVKPSVKTSKREREGGGLQCQGWHRLRTELHMGTVPLWIMYPQDTACYQPWKPDLGFVTDSLVTPRQSLSYPVLSIPTGVHWNSSMFLSLMLLQ